MEKLLSAAEREYTAFRGALEALETAWKIVDLNLAHHYKEHGDQIRAWWTGKGY